MWWHDVMRFYDVVMKSNDEKCDDILLWYKSQKYVLYIFGGRGAPVAGKNT